MELKLKDYTFLNRAQYFQAITAAAETAQPGETVIVEAMNYTPTDAPIAALMDALESAAHNGAQVTLLIDAYNFLADSNNVPGPLFYRPTLSNLRGPYARIMDALKRLEAAGGHYCITNIPTRRLSLPVAGRSHIKGAVMGNRVFVGGCNLHKPQDIDVMVTWENETAANILRSWLLRIAATGRTRTAFGDVDAEASLDAYTRLLLDAGVPGQSLIYEEALKLIDGANERLFITCQFFPGGPTAQHLAAAQARGVHVEISFSHPGSHGTFAPMHQLHQLGQRARRLPRNFFDGKLDRTSPKLHAKVLTSERAALVGSHNYVIQGVGFGTAELALHSSDPLFSKHLTDFMRGELAASSLQSVTPDFSSAD